MFGKVTEKDIVMETFESNDYSVLILRMVYKLKKIGSRISINTNIVRAHMHTYSCKMPVGAKNIDVC